MTRFRLGLCQKALGLPLRRCLPEARKLGVDGLEIEAVGDLAPAHLSQTGRREVLHLFRSHDLAVTAIACPLRRGLAVAEHHEARLDYLRQALSLSYELGARIVVIEPGPLPPAAAPGEEPRGKLFHETLAVLARHADRVGARLALETGPESGADLAAFLGRFDTGGLAVSLNPGNLLVHGHDPGAAAAALRAYLVQVHARDSRQTSAARAFAEVPLGQGDVDWLNLLAILEEIEFRGFVTIDQAAGPNPLVQAGAAVAFLRRLMG
ncbi:MAG: sugar phosphate isomerase/epimerase [Gemmataceae bacterium]|nr:sugar phosphate isomerase/epimerase [Gemmataceae bacterium]